jgi:pseudomonalisin
MAVWPADRASGYPDDRQRMVLRGNVHPLAQAAFDLGAAPGDRRMERMILLLRPDDRQQAALAALVQAQQDPQSPYYHRWLTPEEYEQRFGVSENDLRAVRSWLEGQGFQVEEGPAARSALIFSGTAAQVEAGFHTPIHRYAAHGETHYANAKDPEIPKALAEVVHGVVSLHDFQSAPSHANAAPAFTNSSGAHYLEPGDWVAIYDVAPLYGQGLDGTGQSIAVLGRADISLQDVRTFRSNAGLPANDPQIVVNGPDPGGAGSGDALESTLDVEWSGAIATKAAVKFVTSASGASDGIALSAQYAVANKVAPIITLSYGQCEASLTSTGTAFWNSLWTQAAALGISVFVSSGDGGAAGCDSASAATATHGLGVNGLCSSPSSTCVGGTEFNDAGNPGLYWSATNGSNLASARSYIPEAAWNETGTLGGLWSSGGGASIAWGKPAWQSAPGVPADAKRDVPDVALAAAVHDGYLIQFQGSRYSVGGTSAATPSLASVMALVFQNAGSWQGNVDPVLYTLATRQMGAAGAAVFHDIVGGNNSVPGLAGFNAGTGYDQVTGLGSVDATLLVDHWNDARGTGFALTPSAYTVSAQQGTPGSLSLAVAPQGGFASPVTLSASGAPTGVAVTFSSPTVTAAAPVTVTFTAGAAAVAGTGTVTLTGSGGGLTRMASVTLTVIVPTFSLTPAATSAGVAPGSTTQVALSTVALNGFKSAIALSAGGLPSGVTASFAPASIASPGTGSSTLTLAASSTAAAGTYALTVTGTGGAVTQTAPLSLTVVVPTFTLTVNAASALGEANSSIPIGVSTVAGPSFKSAIALSVAGLPSGVTASFAPASIASPGTGSSILTLTLSSSAAAGTYPLTVTATGGGVTRTAPLSLLVPAATFALTTNAAGVIIAPGGSIPVTVSTAAQNGFKSAIALSVTGLPSGVTAGFAPAGIASPGTGSSTLTLAASAAAAAGTYTLTVTATGGGVTKTAPLSLTIPAAFTLTTNAAAATATQNGSAGVAVSTAAQNGFKSAITLSVTGLPSGVTASFAPAGIASPGTGSSTLTLAASSTAPAGVYSLTIAAAGGGATASAPLALTVLASSFTLTPSASSVTLTPAGSVPITVSTAAVNGFKSAIALSASGLPTGLTAAFAPTSVPSPGTGTSTLTLQAGANAVPGAYTVTVTGTGGGVTRTASIGLTVPAPSFSLTPIGSSVILGAGGSIPLGISTVALNGFKSAIALSASGLPAGVTATFAPASVASPGTGSSTLTLKATSATKTGSYNLTITGTGGGVTVTAPLALTVAAPGSH